MEGWLRIINERYALTEREKYPNEFTRGRRGMNREKITTVSVRGALAVYGNTNSPQMNFVPVNLCV